MKIEIIAFSEHGMALALRIQTWLTEQSHRTQATRCPQKGLAAWTSANFNKTDALLFVGSCGIAVRAIAPHVKDKASDPAVLVIDECSTFVVSLLSGHIGGANALAKELAEAFKARPVITTATDVAGIFAIDTWAVRQGLHIANPDRIKSISARLLEAKSVKLKSDFPIEGKLPIGIVLVENNADVADIRITYKAEVKPETLSLIPPIITLGIGCKKRISAQAIEGAFFEVLGRANCHPKAVRQICSIDLKAEEAGILELAQKYSLPFRTYSAEELNQVPGNFTGSAFVASVTGVDNVCERSAVLGSGGGGQLIVSKQAKEGITMALAIRPYTIYFEGEDL